MLRRFASGSVVACVVIAIATVGALLISEANPQRLSLILAVWCLVPCMWGLWAMLAPVQWVPQRLPIWGMVLGIVAGVIVMFVLNLPWRIFEVMLPATTRAFAVLGAALVYYLMWMVVKLAYQKLSGSALPDKQL